MQSRYYKQRPRSPPTSTYRRNSLTGLFETWTGFGPSAAIAVVVTYYVLALIYGKSCSPKDALCIGWLGPFNPILKHLVLGWKVYFKVSAAIREVVMKDVNLPVAFLVEKVFWFTSVISLLRFVSKLPLLVTSTARFVWALVEE